MPPAVSTPHFHSEVHRRPFPQRGRSPSVGNGRKAWSAAPGRRGSGPGTAVVPNQFAILIGAEAEPFRNLYLPVTAQGTVQPLLHEWAKSLWQNFHSFEHVLAIALCHALSLLADFVCAPHLSWLLSGFAIFGSRAESHCSESLGSKCSTSAERPTISIMRTHSSLPSESINLRSSPGTKCTGCCSPSLTEMLDA